MGGCMSCSTEKSTVYEVQLNRHGVALRVSKGQGTHFIHMSAHGETRLIEKEGSFTEKEVPLFTPVSMALPVNTTRPLKLHLPMRSQRVLPTPL
ncbi:hypothetical protein BDF14DRAFT_926068 [Spinellus fusiger]|nr:hypothetical protein BDF14DRAFT_926068 [Spinellus fusiger]